MKIFNNVFSNKFHKLTKTKALSGFKINLRFYEIDTVFYELQIYMDSTAINQGIR
jgi:hypothetical protein